VVARWFSGWINIRSIKLTASEPRQMKTYWVFRKNVIFKIPKHFWLNHWFLILFLNPLQLWNSSKFSSISLDIEMFRKIVGRDRHYHGMQGND